jgi:hypothetical protein
MMAARTIRKQVLCSMLAALAMAIAACPVASAQGIDVQKDTRPPIAPDIREDATNLKLQRGDFVVVPIPISSPTFGSGLIGGAAYFYPQTDEQKAIQPASMTALAGAYTDNDSRALAIAQQNYWANNQWRFTGAIGGADLRLPLLAPDPDSGTRSTDWRINGSFLFGRLSGQLLPGWYGGLLIRAIDAEQSIEVGGNSSRVSSLLTLPDVRSVGLGFSVEYDTRDMPTNAYSGRYFKANALFNDENIGSNRTYQNYDLAFSSYHQLNESLVLAWQAKACSRKGATPLWDACTIGLRGFPATDYMGTDSVMGQAELRWQMSKRWGLTGFAGTGSSTGNFSETDNRDWVPSYGLGLRFMVLPAKRINMRLDYARSDDNDAIHFLVGEAF